MLNIIRNITPVILTTVLLVGCVSTGNVSMKEHTQDSIDTVIVKSKTTKQEVLAYFGAANSSSFTDSGNEIWTYRYDYSKPMARNFIPYNVFSMGENTQTKELVILFDDKGIVKNYTFRQTATQSKAGLIK